MNDELFRAELPAVLLTLQRKTGSGGYFGANRFSWRNGNDIDRKHEIALNPDGFVGRSDEWIVSVLVHEQCHLLQFVRGEAPKRHYHNKGFASIMLGIGLMPSNTGAVGGKTTGIHMSHYILPDGPFAKAFAKLAASGWKLNLQSAPIIGREGGRTSKTKFSCPQCGLNVWGKPDTHVICGVCLQSGAPDSAALLEPLRLRAVR